MSPSQRSTSPSGAGPRPAPGSAERPGRRHLFISHDLRRSPPPSDRVLVTGRRIGTADGAPRTVASATRQLIAALPRPHLEEIMTVTAPPHPATCGSVSPAPAGDRRQLRDRTGSAASRTGGGALAAAGFTAIPSPSSTEPGRCRDADASADRPRRGGLSLPQLLRVTLPSSMISCGTEQGDPAPWFALTSRRSGNASHERPRPWETRRDRAAGRRRLPDLGDQHYR